MTKDTSDPSILLSRYVKMMGDGNRHIGHGTRPMYPEQPYRTPAAREDDTSGPTARIFDEAQLEAYQRIKEAEAQGQEPNPEDVAATKQGNVAVPRHELVQAINKNLDTVNML